MKKKLLKMINQPDFLLMQLMIQGLLNNFKQVLIHLLTIGNAIKIL